MKAETPFSSYFPPAAPDGKADLYSAYRVGWNIAEMALLMLSFGITGNKGTDGKYEKPTTHGGN